MGEKKNIVDLVKPAVEVSCIGKKPPACMCFSVQAYTLGFLSEADPANLSSAKIEWTWRLTHHLGIVTQNV